MKMRCFKSLERSRSTNTKDKIFKATVDVKKNEETETEDMPGTTRLSRVEQDVVQIFRKLDEIMMAINNMECQDPVRVPY